MCSIFSQLFLGTSLGWGLCSIRENSYTSAFLVLWILHCSLFYAAPPCHEWGYVQLKCLKAELRIHAKSVNNLPEDVQMARGIRASALKKVLLFRLLPAFFKAYLLYSELTLHLRLNKSLSWSSKKQHTVKSFGNCHQERGRNFRELEPEEEGRKKVKVGPEKFFLVVGCQSWEREKISSNYFFLLVENSFQHFFPVKPTRHLSLPFIWET